MDNTIVSVIKLSDIGNIIMSRDQQVYDIDSIRTLLNENDLRIHNVQLVPLDGVVQKFAKSKKVKGFEGDDTISIDNINYITLDTCCELFKHHSGIKKSFSSRNFDNVIDIEKNILQFECTRLTAFFMIHGSKKFDVWVRYNEILDLFQLDDDDVAVKKCNISTYEQLSLHNKFPKRYDKSEHGYMRFINLPGIFQLLRMSSAPNIDSISIFFEKDIPSAFYKYITRIVDYFFHYGDILGVDFEEHAIVRRDKSNDD